MPVIHLPMHKLIILISVPPDDPRFEGGWPDFLHAAEQMPGLVRETSSRVSHVLYGAKDVHMVHELHFETRQALEAALQSEHGRSAGRILQRITGSRMALLFADHHEDLAENMLPEPKSGS